MVAGTDLRSLVTDWMYPPYLEPRIFSDLVFPFLCWVKKNPRKEEAVFWVWSPSVLPLEETGRLSDIDA